ncbi:hypothetical protein [Gemmata sp. SH-PL17]|uniref:hypothetical protein n=1 Tax=Gemmata sp. SH-PL17 TaxID=1630693 RepID=UPI0009EE6061
MTASNSSYRSSKLVTVRSASVTPSCVRWAWISGTDRCSVYRNRPTREDAEGELVVRERQSPLGLGSEQVARAVPASGAAKRVPVDGG